MDSDKKVTAVFEKIETTITIDFSIEVSEMAESNEISGGVNVLDKDLKNVGHISIPSGSAFKDKIRVKIQNLEYNDILYFVFAFSVRGQGGEAEKMLSCTIHNTGYDSNSRGKFNFTHHVRYQDVNQISCDVVVN